MKNVIDFIKDKSYYFMGGTVLLLIIIIVLSSCSNRKVGYDKIESNMVKAAESYYSNNSSRLSKEEGGTIRVSIGTLIENGLLKEIKDPKKKSQTCTGYVEVTKVGKEYSYIPFLVCEGNYEPKYLTDIIKDVKADEYGNGVYTINGELVYRGENVNNYVYFNKQLWRIIKVDSEGDIKLVYSTYSEDSYTWDDAYNSEREDTSGITTDYLKTDIRKTLKDYYEDNFTSNNKALIVSKDLCVGKYLTTDEFNTEKECSIVKENEKVGLLNASDFQNASLDFNCKTLENYECTNYNYLSNKDFRTWILNSVEENSYQVFYIDRRILYSNASSNKKIAPSIYLTKKVLVSDGNGTQDKPYVIK